MKLCKKISFAVALFLLGVAATPLISTSFEMAKAEEGDVTKQIDLRIMNMEDYIYIQDVDEGYEADDLIVQFEEWMRENTKYKNVKVIYDTTDTNETLLTQLQTGKSGYDLICPSDYMIQRMISSDLIIPLNRSDRDTLLSNYDDYCSPYVRNRLDSIPAKTASGEATTVGQYAVGYMWGTLGLLFNPYYSNYNYDKIIKDMQYYSAIYNTDYAGTISIKDSMRDTYAVILMQVYADELAGYRAQYEQEDITAQEYTAKIQEVFDRVDDETLDKVKASLDELKGNIFGLEVDSGKQDIVSGKIGINLAWSGDAVYSMELGAEETNPTTLYYSIPLNGSNIWFDGWVMPNCSRTTEQEEIAYYFLNFISDPANAYQNMDYTGYTSFIGGADILDLVREWYDIRYDEETEEFDSEAEIDPEWEEVDLTYFFDGTLDMSEYTPEDMIFYTEEYYIATEDEEFDNIAVGGDFYCQYPDEETITRCAVMKDYGDRNANVLSMWEKFKSTSLPLWAMILLLVEVAAIVTVVLTLFISKRVSLSLRKKRKLESK